MSFTTYLTIFLNTVGNSPSFESDSSSPGQDTRRIYVYLFSLLLVALFIILIY